MKSLARQYRLAGDSGKALLERLIIIDFTAALYNQQQQGEQLPKNALRNIQNVFIQQGFFSP